MKNKIAARLLMASAVICMGLFFGGGVKAEAAEITVKTDATGKVDATISDAAMNGKNASVICYAPGWSGNTADWSGNKNHISYMSQVKINGATPVSFNIKEAAPAQGNYTLVVSATGSKLTKAFSFYATQQTPVVSVPKTEPLKLTQTAATKVKLTWDKIGGAKKYTISKATKLKGKYKKLATSKKTSYIDKKVKAGKSYFYKVSANGTTYGPYKITLMKAPKIKVKAAKKSAVVSWKKDGAADGYRVYMATKKNGKYKVVSTVKGSKKVKATVKKLKKGKTYFFKVSAYKNNGKKKIAGKASAVKKVKVK